MLRICILLSFFSKIQACLEHHRFGFTLSNHMLFAGNWSQWFKKLDSIKFVFLNQFIYLNEAASFFNLTRKSPIVTLQNH